ncbi:thiamine phosphate synthase [Erythrobacter sp. HKB08]|uniref:thiamine phosphate synthase n=1 Tax=Erythrobacter sp. HKB08 TaxID=2502843 RepID=UPI001F25BC14|nr:thiamine phosphate synthase [Erythrobacter sp. HKB08]
MTKIQAFPSLWLLSDERNDAVLGDALARLPRGSGFIYRHYHLPDPERWERFRALRHLALSRDHTVILADSALTAREWGAHGIYGAPRSLYPQRGDLLQLATAHDLREIADAQRFGADAILLSPAFPTNSHPGAPALGPTRFRLLAARACVPVIALGGMDERRAARLDWPCWAAIDGLS